MIRSFGSRATQDLWNGEDTKAARRLPGEIWAVARRKLDMINAAHELGDLKVPPGNRLEKLHGKLKEFHSVRINDQYRIVFKWTAGGPESVEIVDYH